MSGSYGDLLRRAADQMRADAKVYRPGGQDERLRLTTAALLETIADDMDEHAGTEERDGLAGVAALVGTAFRPSKPWTAALAAARAYLGEA
jgi:hypothetical protein